MTVPPRSRSPRLRLLERVAARAAHVNMHATRLYVLSHRLWQADRRGLALLAYTVNRILTGVDIPPQAAFGPGFLIMHGEGLVVHPDASGGCNCTLYQQVTLGSIVYGEAPQLGDDVTVYPGARLLGGITIGDGARIGANAIVIRDVPAGAVVRSPVAEIVPPAVSPGPQPGPVKPV